MYFLASTIILKMKNNSIQILSNESFEKNIYLNYLIKCAFLIFTTLKSILNNVGEIVLNRHWNGDTFVICAVVPVLHAALWLRSISFM